jgi:hypothetical protein
MIQLALLDAAASLLVACRARGVRLASAESCTGGLMERHSPDGGFLGRGGTRLRANIAFFPANRTAAREATVARAFALIRATLSGLVPASSA